MMVGFDGEARARGGTGAWPQRRTKAEGGRRDDGGETAGSARDDALRRDYGMVGDGAAAVEWTEAQAPRCGASNGAAARHHAPAEERTERLSGKGNQSWASPLG